MTKARAPIHKPIQIAGMIADFDRRLARFERVSMLTMLSMDIAADLGIALGIYDNFGLRSCLNSSFL